MDDIRGGYAYRMGDYRPNSDVKIIADHLTVKCDRKAYIYDFKFNKNIYEIGIESNVNICPGDTEYSNVVFKIKQI